MRGAPARAGPADAAAGQRVLNWKMVAELKTCPGFSSVDGKPGSFGESGRCWVSKVYPGALPVNVVATSLRRSLYFHAVTGGTSVIHVRS